MASPLTKKYKWPSDKKKSNFEASNFVPYVSNIANMFRRVARPMAPDLVNPVVNQKVSLAGARAETENASRAADLAAQGLDAQSGAAVRTSNLATKLRSLNDLSSREAMINAQTGNQTNAINANIDVQNARITNDYRDDLVNAELTQSRLNSENLANMSDKYIAQQTTKDQMKLDKEKTAIMSRQYNPGMYNRLSASLAKDGIDVAEAPKPFVSSFAKYRNISIPNLTTPPATATNTAAPVSTATGPLMSNAQQLQSFPDLLKKKPSPKYLMQKYAAGGMMSAMGEDETGDPVKPSGKRDAYYESSAALAYYKDKLNQKLKAKNPENFGNYFKGLVDLRRSGNQAGADKYVQDTGYNEYLSPEEVRSELGNDYDKYLNSLRTVNDFNVQQGQQPLYGSVEGENDLTKLNYGRRFASLQVTPSLSVTNIGRNTKYNRRYNYDPVTGKSNYTEEGDLTLRPDYVTPPSKAYGGVVKRKSYRTGGKLTKPFA